MFWQKIFMSDALPVANLPICPGLGPASRNKVCASDGRDAKMSITYLK